MCEWDFANPLNTAIFHLPLTTYALCYSLCDKGLFEFFVFFDTRISIMEKLIDFRTLKIQVVGNTVLFSIGRKWNTAIR